MSLVSTILGALGGGAANNQPPVAPTPTPGAPTTAATPPQSPTPLVNLQPDQFAQNVLQQSEQSPQDLYQKYLQDYLGLQPGQKEATGQKVKHGALDALRLMLGGGTVEGMLRNRAQKDYALQTQRLGVASPIERMMASLNMANQRITELGRQLDEKTWNDQLRNILGNRNADIRGDYDQGRIGAMSDRNLLTLRGQNINQPLIQARTGLANQQIQRLKNTGGLPGIFGATNFVNGLPQDQQDQYTSLLEKLRDASKTKNGAAGSNNPFSFHFGQPEVTVDPDSGNMVSNTPMIKIDKATGQATVTPISGNPNALDKPSQVKYSDFNNATQLARDLAETISNNLVSNPKQAPDYMGFLNGNIIAQGLRAKGLIQQGRTPAEALQQLIGANGLFSQVSAFAGRRLTNRELDFFKNVLGKQSDDPASALNSALAAHYVLDTARMRYGHLLGDKADVSDVIQKAITNYTNQIKQGKAAQLPDLRQLLIQNGRISAPGQTSGNNRLFSWKEVSK